MSSLLRVLLVSILALPASTALAAQTTIDFLGGDDLGSTRTVESFNNSQVSFNSNLIAENRVLPELSFTGLLFNGSGSDFLTLDFGTNAISEVALDIVTLTSLEFATDLTLEGAVNAVGGTAVGGPQFIDFNFIAGSTTITFTAGELPFTSLAFTLRSPQYSFTDPSSGDVSSSFLLAGIDSLTYTVDEIHMPPVPEPETYALMLAGLGLISVAVRRSKIK